MVNSYQLCQCGEDTVFTLTLEIETVAFDYEENTRDCKVRLVSETSGDYGLIIGNSGSSTLSVFGRTLQLPQNINASASGPLTVFETQLNGLSCDLYYDGADFTASLKYYHASLGLEPVTVNGHISLPVMLTEMDCYLSGGGSVVLGNNVSVISGMPEQGYSLTVTVKDGNTELFEKTLTAADMSFKTEQSWITGHENAKSFTATVNITAAVSSSADPLTKSFSLICTLGESDALPSASVSTSVVTNNPVLQQTGLVLRNRSGIKITVSNIVCKYGAYLIDCVRTVDGIEYDNNEVSQYFSVPGEHGWSVTLKDSRGYIKRYSGTFTVVDYGPPQFTAEVKRVNEAGQESLSGARFSVSVDPDVLYTLYGQLSYTYEYCWRATGGTFSSWTELQPQSTVVVNAALDSATMYEVSVRCSDSAGTATVKTFPLDCERVELHISKNRVAVGKRAETDDLFDCRWDIKSGGDISFTGSDGEEISLRGFYESLNSGTGTDGALFPLRYKLVNAASNEEISSFVNNIYTIVGNCAFSVLVLSVKGDGLSLNSGLHLYFVQNDGTRMFYRKM